MLVGGAYDDGHRTSTNLASISLRARGMGTSTETPINSAPQHHYVAEAALAHLDAWVRTGAVPPHGAPIGSTPRAGSCSTSTATSSGEFVPRGSTCPRRSFRTRSDGGGVRLALRHHRAIRLGEAAALYPAGPEDYLPQFAQSLSSCVTGGSTCQPIPPRSRPGGSRARTRLASSGHSIARPWRRLQDSPTICYTCTCAAARGDGAQGRQATGTSMTTITGPISGGSGWAFGATTVELKTVGYLEEEYFFEGEAPRYQVVGGYSLDGRWQAQPNGSSGFKTTPWCDVRLTRLGSTARCSSNGSTSRPDSISTRRATHRCS